MTQSNGGRKNRPGNKELHAEALVENAAFVPKPKPKPVEDIIREYREGNE